MRIEHVAMYVSDLEKTKNFFVKYFNASASNQYHNNKTGFYSYFLNFEDSSRLEIMTKPDLKNNFDNSSRYGYIHIAFQLGSRQAVDSLTVRLQNDGYSVISGPRITGDGYYESCIIGIEGNLIELIE